MLHFQTFKRIVFQSMRVSRQYYLKSNYKDIEIPKLTIGELYFQYASLYPNNIAYIDDTRNLKYSYSDTTRCINGIASALTKKGVKSGTMVGIIASNCPEYIMLAMALSSMGCSVTVCNQNYTKNEITNQLTDSKPSILFTDSENLDKVSNIGKESPSVKDIYLIGDRLPSYGSVQDLMEDSGDMSPIGQIDIDLDNHVALMPYSSGTTGLPKGVMITHKNLVAMVLQIESSIPVDGCKTMMMNLPLFHIYGMVAVNTMAFMSGSTAVVQPKFDPIKYLKAIEKYKIKMLHLVPPQILFFINNPEVSKFDISSIEQCYCGAASLDRVTESRFIEKLRIQQPKFNLNQGYGLSETSSLNHIMPTPLKFINKKGSVGTLIPNMQCKVVDVSTRQELGPNLDGELLLKGPNVMKGYFGKASETEKAFENGWFRTGDIARYDEDEYFYIIDRLKELIKVKGFQVAPAEIEGLLLSHPAIGDCAVVGVPDEKCGEVPKAFIVKSKDVDEKEIHAFVSEHLSPHKYLKGGIVFINQIPKSPSGKILRRLLKEK